MKRSRVGDFWAKQVVFLACDVNGDSGSWGGPNVQILRGIHQNTIDAGSQACTEKGEPKIGCAGPCLHFYRFKVGVSWTTGTLGGRFG